MAKALMMKILFQNVIVQTLNPKARIKYVKQGSKNLCNENNVLDQLEEIQESIELEIEVNTDQKARLWKQKWQVRLDKQQWR